MFVFDDMLKDVFTNKVFKVKGINIKNNLIYYRGYDKKGKRIESCNVDRAYTVINH